MTSDRRVLADPTLDRRLQRDGFVTFPLLGPDEVEPLRQKFVHLRPRGSGFHSDLVVPDPAYRRETDRLIAEAVDERLESRFVGYTTFLHNFVCKYPGPDNELYLHQDWMYVDERSGRRTYAAWIALEDIDGDNGQLQVLRSSHRLPRSPRGTRLTAPWLAHEQVIRERLSWIPLPAGHCVVFDNALVHCSAPNRTADVRVAAAVGLHPVGAELVHFRRTGDSTATLHRVDRDFFLDRTPQDLEITGPAGEPLELLDLDEVQIDARSLARRSDRPPLARLDQARRLGRRARGAPGRAAGRLRAARDATGRALAARRRSLTARADRVRTAVPSTVRRWREELPPTMAIRVLGMNEAMIDRFGPDTPAVWDHRGFAWSAALEDAWPEIRAEVDALLAGPKEIPHIEEVTGGIPQGNEGPWRSFVLMHQGRWIDWNCERCPRTTELVRTIPGLSMAGFSVLEAGTHITEHRGPNKGALRYQLGVIVPGADGDCRIRVGTEMLHWREGEGVAFDFTVPHEAWNDTDAIRVLLMIEVLTPLPWYLAVPNRFAQRAMGWFPTTRDMTRRLRALEPTLVKSPATG